MARKRHSGEDILKLLDKIELKLTAGDDVASVLDSLWPASLTYTSPVAMSAEQLLDWISEAGSRPTADLSASESSNATAANDRFEFPLTGSL